MARMRTFLLYALGILGFMFLSYVLENGLIANMYKTMQGEIIPSNSDVVIENASGRASNVNGFMNFKLTNHSNGKMKDEYIKIDLYSKNGLYAASKYVKIEDLPAGESRNYQVKFKGTEIGKYQLSLLKELPDKTNIISILGWEIDITDVFGVDLSKASIFGARISEIFSWENVHVAGTNAWNWTKLTLQSVPWWGYAIGAGIILWYMPNGFLLGIFPF